MRSSVLVALMVCCGSVVSSLLAQEPAAPAAEVLAWAQKISSQAATSRRSAIEGLLDAAKIPYERQPFLMNNKGSGVNLELRFGPSEGPALVLCAHHDARVGSTGANDDAAGCAVLIKLAHELQQSQSLRRPVLLLFLDCSNKGLIGTDGWAEYRRQQAIDRVLVFDLCGRGDQLVIGSLKYPLANSALALVPGAEVLAGDLPTDHKQFARLGLDASFVSTCPTGDLAALRQRYEARDFKATLPDFINETIRGRDSADKLEPEALVLALNAARQAVELAQVGPAAVTYPNPEYLVEIKELETAFVEADFKKVAAGCESVGFNGLLTVLQKLQSGPDFKSQMDLALRLVAGSELRALMKEFAQDPEAAGPGLARVKPRLILKQGHFSLLAP